MPDPAPFFIREPVTGFPTTTEFGQVLDTGNGPYRHRGTDLGTPEGTPLFAPAAGVVVSFTNDGSFGRHSVCLDHENGLVSLYAHMSRADVAVGQRVTAGQQLGLTGHEGFYADGTSIGYAPHLHWQLCVSTQFPTGRPTDYVLSVPINSSGKVSGIELSYEQPLFGNFGVSTNYTYANAKESGGGPLVGASKNTYNLSGSDVSWSCNTNEVLIGWKGKASGSIDQLQAICAALAPQYKL